MLTYFITGSNNYTFRTTQSSSNSFTMSLQDMLTQENIIASISTPTYNECESMIMFSASIANAYVGQEFRATVSNGTEDIWNGSIQVFALEPNYKSIYQDQIPLDSSSISHDSSNEYIIMN